MNSVRFRSCAAMTLAALVLLGIACGKDDKRMPEATEVSGSIQNTPTPVVVPTKESTPEPTPVTSQDTKAEDVAEPLPQEVALKPQASQSGPPMGLATIAEQVLASDVVARVSLRTIEASWRRGPRTQNVSPHVIMTFDVVEALQGTPGATAVVEMGVGKLCCHDSEAKALELANRWIDGHRRHWAQWIDHDSVVFLWDVSRLEWDDDAYTRPAKVKYVFTDRGDDSWHRDTFSVFSKTNRTWLPGTMSDSGEWSFYTHDPSWGITVTLDRMKTLVAMANAMVDPSVEGHKECLIAKFREERNGHPKLPNFQGVFVYRVESGQPANTVVVRVPAGSTYRDIPAYPQVYIDGPNTHMFRLTTSDGNTNPHDKFWVEIKALRPLHAGAHIIQKGYQESIFIPCGHFPYARNKYVVYATAPEGTLHELFFDPVTVGNTVVADSSNGTLSPASFISVNRLTVRINKIFYQQINNGMGFVSIELAASGTSLAALAGHVVEFIELDGSVSFSLPITNAIESADGDDLFWSVPEAPWKSGDKLMVRIRKALP